MNQNEASTVTPLSFTQLHQLLQISTVDDTCQIDNHQIQTATSIGLITSIVQQDLKYLITAQDSAMVLKLNYPQKQYQEIEEDSYYRFYIAIKSHKNGRYLLCLGLSKIIDHNELTIFLATVIHDTLQRRAKKVPRRESLDKFFSQNTSFTLQKSILEIMERLQGDKGVTTEQVYSILAQKHKEREVQDAMIQLKQNQLIQMGQNPFFFISLPDAVEKLISLNR